MILFLNFKVNFLVKTAIPNTASWYYIENLTSSCSYKECTKNRYIKKYYKRKKKYFNSYDENNDSQYILFVLK